MVTFPRIAAAVIAALFLILGSARSAPDTTLVSKICNGATYNPFSTYATNVAQVLLCLPDAAYSGFNKYCQSTESNDDCYGHAACNGALHQPDCATCLEAIVNRINNECMLSIGVQYQLKDCRLRYEHYPFTE
ncbi:antifungal protein ginkbilobin-like protein [Syzygium oleosum]|uniref:antifungal protein ginkbilobin-like protein n=1 Tax=Syzygium oleosum TaxID=219896 RepID=UPI0024BBEA87|nr:antifungal protein ginkbilobin-like protein [Syzygium oleosum]